MTILEATGHLYNWYTEHDTFCIDKDFLSLITITEHPNQDKATVLCGLKKMKEMGLVSDEWSPDNHRQYWILNKSLASFEQSVAVSPDLALTISNIINTFCERIEDDKEKCDPTNIEEKDLKNLIYIANLLISEKKDIDNNSET